MGIIQKLFGKKQSSCCDVKVVEVKPQETENSQSCCSAPKQK